MYMYMCIEISIHSFVTFLLFIAGTEGSPPNDGTFRDGKTYFRWLVSTLSDIYNCVMCIFSSLQYAWVWTVLSTFKHLY